MSTAPQSPPSQSPPSRLLVHSVLLRVPGRVPRMAGPFRVSLGRHPGTVDRPVAVTVAAGLRVAVLVVAGRRMSILARC